MHFDSNLCGILQWTNFKLQLLVLAPQQIGWNDRDLPFDKDGTGGVLIYIW